MTKFFDSPTMRLTLWYMLILSILSLLFSTIVFQITARELHRPYGPRQNIPGLRINDTTLADEFEQLRLARENEATKHLIENLVVFNFITIAAGGFASYLLAKRTLHPIEQALEAQTRFSSDVAHELRTPLAVMQSEIEIGLRAPKATSEDRKELLESNLDEVHRLRALTDRLLILASEKELPLAPTHLDDVATEAINRVISLAQTHKIGIESTVGKQIAEANFDTLTDAVVILLDNAIKYSPAKSEVTISAEDHGKHILLHIADNGIGIAEDDLPHLFDRFYRADTSRSKKNVDGHGLGLSIAKRIVESHNGKISVTSTEGKGTTFTIKLHAAD